jgi:ribosomal protein L32
VGALPKRKIPRGGRRAHIGKNRKLAELSGFTKDPDSGKLIPRHTVSPYTGKYRGRQILAIE